MFSPNEANNILEFLNRVAITGHQERQAMTEICNKLIPLAQTPKQAVGKQGEDD